jgi:methylthioribose-1-phosphate isomerase
VSAIESVRWAPSGDAVRIIDQTRLPGELVERDLRTVAEVVDAIRALAVRGAPAIGVAGAIGLVATLLPHATETPAELDRRVARHAEAIGGARPTAVNLPWAMRRMTAAADAARAAGADNAALLAALRAEATAILEEDRAMCRRIGEHALALLESDAAEPRAERRAELRVLTHCNAGALATAGIGTALAPVYLAAERGWRVAVWADETRPLLQGSRLTAWELARAGIPVTVIADNMAAALLRRGGVDAVLVGADRIAANGDVANKVGTYALALAARAHGVPFYVLAPTSTFDPATATGAEIPIEERDPGELRTGPGGGRPTAPEGVAVWNPAFDVTPASLVTAIVSDAGVHRPPYAFGAPGTPSGG